MADKNLITVGSRKSDLALIQTKHVISLLKHKFPEKEFKIITMTTLGDKILGTPLPKIGEKSLFTKELETALATGRVDLIVHSLKDLPTSLPEGMAIGAILKREDPRDALVLRENLKGYSLQTLNAGSVIGTSSLRRTAQITRKYPHLIVKDIRGNLNTRLRKLDESGIYSAVVLAQAGLHRMKWDHRISEVIDSNDILYAVGQGALAVECRDKDFKIIEMLKILHDSRTVLEVLAERSFLKTLGGGCSAPVAVKSMFHELEGKTSLELMGAVWNLDGSTMIADTKKCFIEFNMQDKIKITNQISNPIRNVDNLEIDISKEIYEDGTNEISKWMTLNNTLGTECPFIQQSKNKCPVSLPVGIDFMGKCPYLDIQYKMKNRLTNTEIPSTSSQVPLDCSFTSNEIKSSDTELLQLTSCVKYSKLYCGIINSTELPEQILINAENLGIELANSLISNGALNVVQESKSCINSK